MNYCHECGSEIAEIDTFCPFCGISLKPSVVSEEESAENDKTVAVNMSELTDDAAQSETRRPETSQTETVEETQDPDDETEQSVSDSTEDTTAATQSPTVPEPLRGDSGEDISLLEIGEDQQSDVSDSTESALPAEEIELNELPNDVTLFDMPRPQIDKEPSKAPETSEAANPEPEETFDAPDEQDHQETIPENVAPDFSESAGEDAPSKPLKESPALEDDFIQTVPYVNYRDLIGEKPVNSAADQSDSKQSPAKAESDPVIQKPEVPVEQSENRDTTYDSVRIMDDGADEVRESSNAGVSAAHEKIDDAQKKSADKERPQTTPNIGVGDTAGRKSAKLKPLDEGTVLNGRYEIVRKIGGGGMGAVYLATDRNLGGILRAVKEMIQSYIEEVQQDKAISDFKRESMLLTSLDHPSIPTIYDYFYDDKEGRFYLVMKYISGGDLASRLRSAPEGRIDEETVVNWAIQVADVLDYLHNRQPPIVYRDLKPANIMIDGNTSRTMLIDFGIARWINKEEKGVTAVGTMGYAPPELFSGKVAPSSDIYSLGSTMFHLLTGADPQSNPLLIFDFQKHPRPRQINPQLSDQIEKILMRMVEYNAEKRFKSAADARDALAKHLENLKAGKATFGKSKTPNAVPFSEQTVFCGFCGQKIVATDMFCAFCGSKQPIAQQGIHSAEYHLPQTTAKLVVLGTHDLELPTFVIEKDDNLLGRRDPLSNIFPEIDLSKYDPQTKISRRHAHIWRQGGEFLIEDLGSSNGTLVMRLVGDAVKLNPHQPHPLLSGEKIKIGDTTLHFVVG